MYVDMFHSMYVKYILHTSFNCITVYFVYIRSGLLRNKYAP